jgi:sugar phosphate permease
LDCTCAGTSSLSSLSLNSTTYSSNLTVVTPILKDDEGLSKEQIGFLISIGTIGYVVGKAVYGPLCDVVGGGKVMQIAMMGSVAVTFLFAISPASMFALLVILWTLNRFVQAGGWPAVMKIVSHW